MSITYCHNCNKNIDEDNCVEHFDVCGKEECKVCGELTELVFNIRLKETPVCQKCATAITKQELQSMFEYDRQEAYKKGYMDGGLSK